MTLLPLASMIRRCAVALVMALVVAGCGGGSGSSGFDAAFSENGAIMQALAESHCVAHAGLSICPADVATPPGAPGAVETGLDQAGSVACAPSTDGACSFSLPFMPLGFPSNAAFRVVSRSVGPLRPWRMGALPMPNGPPDSGDLEVPVNFPAAGGDRPAPLHVQIAVLVYLKPLPSNVPSMADGLASFDADFAFVTQQLTAGVQP